MGQKLKELKEPPTINHHGLLNRNRRCEFQTPFIHHCRRRNRPKLATTTHIPISPTPVATITAALTVNDSDHGRIGIGIGSGSSTRINGGIAATSSEPAAGPPRSIQFDHSDARDHTISPLLSFQVR